MSNAAVEVTPESSRRRHVAGDAFKLADGRAWTLAAPLLFLRPVFLPDPPDDGSRPLPELARRRRVEVEERWDYPEPARTSVRAFLESVAGGSETFPLGVVVAAALDLLLIAHQLPDDQAGRLLDLDRDSAEELAVGMLRMFRGLPQHAAPETDRGPIEDRPQPAPESP